MKTTPAPRKRASVAKGGAGFSSNLDGAQVEVLGFLEQMKNGFDLKGSPQLRALLDRALEGRKGPGEYWWKRGVSGVPLGGINEAKSVSILVLCCIDNVLDSRLVGYDVGAGLSGDFRSWLLEHVRKEFSLLLRGVEDPRDMAQALSSVEGIKALGVTEFPRSCLHMPRESPEALGSS